MGMLGASFGVAFVIGPAIGGILSGKAGPRAPFAVAAVASLCNLATLFLIKEPPKRSGRGGAGSDAGKARGKKDSGALQMLLWGRAPSPGSGEGAKAAGARGEGEGEGEGEDAARAERAHVQRMVGTLRWTLHAKLAFNIAKSIYETQFTQVHQRMNERTNEPMNQRTNEPTNQPTDQPTNRPTNQRTNEPTNRPTNLTPTPTHHSYALLNA